MSETQNWPSWYKGPMHDCNRCGQRYPKLEMTQQDGGLVCWRCVDNKSDTYKAEKK